MNNTRPVEIDTTALVRQIKRWGTELGFQQLAVSDVRLDDDEGRLAEWLDAGYHGEMAYMAKHGHKRTRPAELVDGTLSVICARMNYLPEPNATALDKLSDTSAAYISRYALGRDYHKVMRRRLQRLAELIEQQIGEFGYRVFTDSAPVMERALARKAGLGWVGKHTNLIDRNTGSWFFLGEIYTDLPLTTDSEPSTNYCGSCTACLDACPTGAIVGPYRVDARRCISYLTIELKGSIPTSLRRDIGNRIFGCDDCQLVCPWNRYAKLTTETDFKARHGLDDRQLLDLFDWDEREFDRRTEGSAIRRISFEQWTRNLAIALGNAPGSKRILEALRSRLGSAGDMAREHIEWAINEQHDKLGM